MAERYVSALTGPEMDEALLDMARHNSEAWAIGERHGEAVGSTDDTYQNNSKYYATEAEAAAARAEAAVPAGTEGAVLFSQAQSLTAAQKQTAFGNIVPADTKASIELVNKLTYTRYAGINSLEALEAKLQEAVNAMPAYGVRFIGFTPSAAFTGFNQNAYITMIAKGGNSSSATFWFFKTSGGRTTAAPKFQYIALVGGSWVGPVQIVV